MATTETKCDTDVFYGDIAAAELQPLWTQAGDLLTRTPKPKTVPWRWDGAVLRQLAARAGDLVPIEKGGDRRVLALANPGLGGAPYTTPTLWTAIQYLNPHESAPAHRHSAAAIRFVIEGEGVSTSVDGDACSMTPGDLILTPGWTWHEHTSRSDEPMVWLDGLDLPLVHALETMFFDPHPDGTHPEVAADGSEHLAAPGLLPAGQERVATHSPLLVYRWAATDAALDRQLAGGSTTASVAFTNPTTGGPALPTLGCLMHRVPGGQALGEARQSGNRVLYVRSGTAHAEVGEQTWEVAAGDVLCVPSWVPFSLAAAQATDVFELTDAPVLDALHLLRRSGPIPA